MDNGKAPNAVRRRPVPTDMSPTDASFSAEAVDHQFQPTAPTAADRRGLAYAILAAAVLHLIIPLVLLLYSAFAPRPAPEVQEIPVEILVEKPPPKPEEKPQPPPQPVDERPAYDAPSAASQEMANRESRDDKTTAPAAKAEPAPNAGAPAESRE